MWLEVAMKISALTLPTLAVLLPLVANADVILLRETYQVEANADVAGGVFYDESVRESASASPFDETARNNDYRHLPSPSPLPYAYDEVFATAMATQTTSLDTSDLGFSLESLGRVSGVSGFLPFGGEAADIDYSWPNSAPDELSGLYTIWGGHSSMYLQFSTTQESVFSIDGSAAYDPLFETASFHPEGFVIELIRTDPDVYRAWDWSGSGEFTATTVLDPGTYYFLSSLMFREELFNPATTEPFGSYSFSFTLSEEVPTSVTEPGTLALCVIGLIGMGLARRKTGPAHSPAR